METQAMGPPSTTGKHKRLAPGSDLRTLIAALASLAAGVGGGYGIPRVMTDASRAEAVVVADHRTAEIERRQAEQAKQIAECREAIIRSAAQQEAAIKKLDEVADEVRGMRAELRGRRR